VNDLEVLGGPTKKKKKKSEKIKQGELPVGKKGAKVIKVLGSARCRG